MSGSELPASISFDCNDQGSFKVARLIQERGLNVTRTETWVTARFHLPDDVTERLIELSYDKHDDLVASYELEDGTIVGVNWGIVFKRLQISVVGVSREVVDKHMAEFQKEFPKLEVKQEEPRLQIKVWANSDHGPRAYDRFLDSQTFDEVKPNYTRPVQQALADLVDWTPPSDANGKLIIWHGIPGTGKTWAVRMLAKSWSSWCTANFIADPEQFFGADPNYLFRVAVAEEGQNELAQALGVAGTQKEPKWRLIILEDAGELISQDAKQRSGQGMSRFLNLTDGLLGQGLRSLVLITTNEDDEHLHDAVKRPGRCLATMKFEPLTADEARAWLDSKGFDHSKMKEVPTKLCELYDLLAPNQITVEQAKKVVGFAR